MNLRKEIKIGRGGNGSVYRGLNPDEVVKVFYYKKPNEIKTPKDEFTLRRLKRDTIPTRSRLRD